MVQKLELLRTKLPDDHNPGMIFEAFLHAKCTFVELFHAYQALHAQQVCNPCRTQLTFAQLQDWNKCGRKLHLFHVLYLILEKWRLECPRNSPEWYVTCFLSFVDVLQGLPPETGRKPGV